MLNPPFQLIGGGSLLESPLKPPNQNQPGALSCTKELEINSQPFMAMTKTDELSEMEKPTGQLWARKIPQWWSNLRNTFRAEIWRAKLEAIGYSSMVGCTVQKTNAHLLSGWPRKSPTFIVTTKMVQPQKV